MVSAVGMNMSEQIAITVEIGSGQEPERRKEQGHDMPVPDSEEKCRTVKELQEFLHRQEVEKSKAFLDRIGSASMAELIEEGRRR